MGAVLRYLGEVENNMEVVQIITPGCKLKCLKCGTIRVSKTASETGNIFRRVFPCRECKERYYTSISVERRMYSEYKVNAKKRGFEFSITLEQFTDFLCNECHYCGGNGISRWNAKKPYLKNIADWIVLIQVGAMFLIIWFQRVPNVIRQKVICHMRNLWHGSRGLQSSIMTSIEELTSKLNPKTQQRIRMASQMETTFQPTPSLGLNKALGGGLRYGAQHMVWGPRSAGKSLFLLQLVALAQKEGKSCVWVDAEGAYTPQWGERLGVNNDELIYIGDQRTYAGVTNEVVPLIRAGVDVVVIDSISTLLSGSYFEKDGVDMKAFEDTNQIGQNAREGAKMCGMFNMVNENTLIVLISQITVNLGGYMAINTHTVGKKVEHLNTTQIKLSSSLAEANQIKGDVSLGDQVFTEPIGRPVSWTLDKDRGPGMGRKGGYDMYYAGDHVGIDTVGEMVDIAVTAGVVRKSGAWFYYGDHKFQGKANLISELRQNGALFDEIVAAV